jgi:hypothetical protein
MNMQRICARIDAAIERVLEIVVGLSAYLFCGWWAGSLWPEDVVIAAVEITTDHIWPAMVRGFIHELYALGILS